MLSRISATKMENIEDLWKQGLNGVQISEKTGLSTKTVYRKLKTVAGYCDRHAQIKIRDNEIYQAWKLQSKKNASKIGREFDISRQRVQQIIEKLSKENAD